LGASILLDHLAIGVERWTDGYPRLAVELGGDWSHGGESGPFASCQLSFRHGMNLELIAPSGRDGFVRRFLDRHGPGAHHVTFMVPSLHAALEAVGALGIEALGGSDVPVWREAFLHPKQCGVGTLIQLVERDEVFIDALHANSPAPPDFPADRGDQQAVAWVGLTTASPDRAEALFAEALHGRIAERGPAWTLYTWGPGRSLLVRTAGADPGDARLWAGAPTPGVAHVVMGPAGLLPQHLENAADAARLLPHDERTGTPVWIANESLVVARSA
jgi:methylmalonyl-CoA/ethylmalonyl-CoA epimerase